VAFETVDLFRTPLGAAELRALLRKLGASPRDVLRTKDPAYAQHGLASGRHTDEQLIALMAANPGLIQRPIVVRGPRAVVARPVEAIEALLG
jgi:arsenate reductase